MHFFLPECFVGAGYGGLQVRQHGGDMTELDMVDDRFYGATVFVTQYDDQFRARYLAGEFEAAQHIRIDIIAGNPHHEQLSDTAMEYVFHRNPGIDTGKDNRFGILPQGGFPYPFRIVPYR